MNEENSTSFISLLDDDGNEVILEPVGMIEYNGTMYYSFFPAVAEGEEESEDDDEQGLVILKAIQENGEEILSTLDSDEELEAVYEEFMKELFEDMDDDE